eukprot:4209213-Amphidinium_carterae.2
MARQPGNLLEAPGLAGVSRLSSSRFETLELTCSGLLDATQSNALGSVPSRSPCTASKCLAFPREPKRPEAGQPRRRKTPKSGRGVPPP